jgi:hypothetical protein
VLLFTIDVRHSRHSSQLVMKNVFQLIKKSYFVFFLELCTNDIAFSAAASISGFNQVFFIYILQITDVSN